LPSVQPLPIAQNKVNPGDSSSASGGPSSDGHLSTQTLSNRKFRSLRVRIGIHCGEDVEKVLTDRGVDYLGPDVNFAARVSGVGAGGQILLSASAVGVLLDPVSVPEALEMPPDDCKTMADNGTAASSQLVQPFLAAAGRQSVVQTIPDASMDVQSVRSEKSARESDDIVDSTVDGLNNNSTPVSHAVFVPRSTAFRSIRGGTCRLRLHSIQALAGVTGQHATYEIADRLLAPRIGAFPVRASKGEGVPIPVGAGGRRRTVKVSPAGV